MSRRFKQLLKVNGKTVTRLTSPVVEAAQRLGIPDDHIWCPDTAKEVGLYRVQGCPT